MHVYNQLHSFSQINQAICKTNAEIRSVEYMFY